MLQPYGWPSQKQLNHVDNLLSVDVRRTALDSANAKKQDSDVLNCVNEVADAHISILAILRQGGFSVGFEHMVVKSFRKHTKFAID